MIKTLLGSAVLAALLAFASAQEYVGAWVFETTVDAFSDERTTVILTGENGAQAADSEAVLGVVCRNGALESFLVQFRNVLDTGAEKEFDYRLDSGPVQTGRAWLEGRGMGLSSEVDRASFAAFGAALASGAERLAVRVAPRNGEPLTGIFLLAGWDEVLSEAECAMGEGARPSP